MKDENFEWVTISKIEFFRSSEDGKDLLNKDGSIKMFTIDVDCEAVVEGVATDSDGTIEVNFSVDDNFTSPVKKGKLVTIMREHWLRLQKEMPAIEKTNNQSTDKE
tara:strand:+ start:466 stop:783 length:318 start_codon:yes stop_codon:yes gene_type:complete